MISVRVAESDKINEDYSIYVSFPFDNTIVNTIRKMSNRYWHADNKEWELPLFKLKTLLSELNGYEFNITGKYITLEKPEAKIPDNFKFKTNPFKHQIEGFNYGLQYDRWLLGDEQGLGKTKQVIDIAVAKKLQKCYKHCLIICGVNGLKWNWQNEIKTHSNESGWILGQRTKNGKTKIGSINDRLYDLQHLNELSAYFLVTNIESLRSPKIVAELKSLCDRGEINMIAVDEIHKAKNSASQQGKGLLKLQPECRIAMTGTPLMNNPIDLFIILKWLGYEKHALYSFKQHYCVFGGFGGHDIIGYKNLSDLQEQVNHIMLRRLKSDVLDLPEKLYIDEYVEMTGKQEQVYKEVATNIRMNIDKIKCASNPLAELIRLRQATGYTGILSSTIKESAKMDRLGELVDENIENNKKVIIFSNWTQMTTPIYDMLHKKYNGIIITGETKDSDRQHNVDLFQNNKDYKFAIGTIGAMGTGLTLTSASTVIFIDEPWTMAAKQQAIDRAHRIGTKENVTVYTLMAKNTIDERIHQLVEKKGAMSDALIDGKVATHSSELLDFLLS